MKTNIYEQLMGAINIAPIKLSGKYKVVCSIDNKLYLDDYSGRRVPLDSDNSFLSQVSNFLKVNTSITNTDKLRYGANQESKVMSYHIPLYFGPDQTTPDFYVLNRVPGTFDNKPETFRIHQLIDLRLVGIKKIFDEINNTKWFDYPLYLNLESDNVKLFGYDTTKDNVGSAILPLAYSRANQNYLDVFNNKLLNSFGDNNLIYPRFINFEFEFAYTNNTNHLHNFYGYFSISKPVTTPTISNAVTIKAKQYNDISKSIYTQCLTNDVSLTTYTDIDYTATVRAIEVKMPIYKIRVTRYEIHDTIACYGLNGEVMFSYSITEDDVADDFGKSLLAICSKCTQLSGREFIFNCTVGNGYAIITITWNNLSTYDVTCGVSIPVYYQPFERFTDSHNMYLFRDITDTDVWLTGDRYVQSIIGSVEIEGTMHGIVEKFIYDGKTILRLDSVASIDIDKPNTIMTMYTTKTEQLLELHPIAFLSHTNKLTTYEHFNQLSYVNELIDVFIDGDEMQDPNSPSYIAYEAIQAFNKRNNIVRNEYVTTDANGDLQPTNVIPASVNNGTNILDMSFVSTGTTAHISPNILNIDLSFFNNSGCLNYNLLLNDDLRFSWFLIHSECPKYLVGDVRRLRYFTDKPELLSNIVNVNGVQAETVFLGVKYVFELQYAGYSFAVYLEPNDASYTDITYRFSVDLSTKTLYLVVYKYLDFVDLLRGGNGINAPFIDLSFFHNTTKALNTATESLDKLSRGGMFFAPDFEIKDYLFGVGLVYDWKHYDTVSGEWYILVTRETVLVNNSIDSFLDLFTPGTDGEVYVYGSIVHEGEEKIYKAITIRYVGIKFVESGYFWCKDIEFSFFDESEIYIRTISGNGTVSVNKIDFDLAVVSIVPESDTIFGDYINNVLLKIDGKTDEYRLFNRNKISLKQSYFEITHRLIQADNGQQTYDKTVFRFPGAYPLLDDNDLIYSFDNRGNINWAIDEYKVTLFDRNQIWYFLHDITRRAIRFKDLVESQVRKILNEMIITKLVDYSNFRDIPVSGAIDEYIKLSIVPPDNSTVIWPIRQAASVVPVTRISTVYRPLLLNVPLATFVNQILTADNQRLYVPVSCIFCMDEPLYITIPKDSTTVKLVDMLSLLFERPYAEYLLTYFYKLDSIVSDTNQSILFTYNKDDANIIVLSDTNRYINTINQLKLIFTRK